MGKKKATQRSAAKPQTPPASEAAPKVAAEPVNGLVHPPQSEPWQRACENIGVRTRWH